LIIMKARTISIILFLAFNIPAFAQIDASFEADTTSVRSLEVLYRSEYEPKDTVNYDFLWDFGDGNKANEPDLVHRYEKAGVYNVSLKVTRKRDMISDINAKDVEVSDEFRVQNVFTPDGDGLNDLFIVEAERDVSLSITIFDRSGAEVFKMTAPTIVWDGRTPSGIMVKPGVYYYIIRSEVEMYNKTGFIHIYY